MTAAFSAVQQPEVPEQMRLDEEDELIEPVVGSVNARLEAPARAVERRQAGWLLLGLALIAGLVVMALDLAQQERLVRIARVLLAAVGCAAVAGRVFTVRRDRSQPHGVTAVAGVALATLVATWTALSESSSLAGRAAFLAGTVLSVAALDLGLVARVARPIEEARRRLRWSLDGTARKVVARGKVVMAYEEVAALQRGDQVVVEVGARVPVDVTVVRGEVQVLPWPGADKSVRRRAGDVVVAGSEVLSGKLRGRCEWVGDERALARPLLNPATRADIGTYAPRLARRVIERWAPVTAVVVAGLLLLLGWTAVDTAMLVVAGYAACGAFAIGALPPLSLARAARTALGRGIVHASASAWDRAAAASTAVFCARGTLVKGEPELVEVDAFAGSGQALGSPKRALALAAGATASQHDPVAVALRRAAVERGVAIEPVRGPRLVEGCGVTAVAPTGEALCVGNRALLLDCGVSVAAAEKRVYELEQRGRTVVLVARAGRLVGMLGLQDGLRSGARAAVQHLLDVGVEPVLMSPDTRDTCEALGRALDIDHLRPEVSEQRTADAVQRIRDTGAMIAVLGHAPHDDVALAAADVSVALAAAGSERDDFDIALVTDDVRDASLALALALRARRDGLVVLLLTLGPAVFGTVVAIVGLLPAEYAPMAQLVGAVVAAWSLIARDNALG